MNHKIYISASLLSIGTLAAISSAPASANKIQATSEGSAQSTSTHYTTAVTTACDGAISRAKVNAAIKSGGSSRYDINKTFRNRLSIKRTQIYVGAQLSRAYTASCTMTTSFTYTPLITNPGGGIFYRSAFDQRCVARGDNYSASCSHILLNE